MLAACAADWDCADADTYCIDEICQPPEPDGAACSFAIECASWFCDRTGTCASAATCR